MPTILLSALACLLCPAAPSMEMDASPARLPTPTTTERKLAETAGSADRAPGDSPGAAPDLSGFFYQSGRKLTLGVIAAMNSEVLFGNARPLGGLQAAGLIYVPSMILVDELIQGWNLDAVSMFYLGAIYGIWLEGPVVNTIPEAPLWFLTGITTFWHGLLTTYAAAELTELWIPRREPGKLQLGWTIAGASAVALLPFLVQPKARPFSLDDWPAHTASTVTAGGFGLLLWDRIRRGRVYQPTPLFALGSVAVGFGLGLGVLAITAEENGGESVYRREDHLLRSGIYLSVELSSILKLIADGRRRGSNQE